MHKVANKATGCARARRTFCVITVKRKPKSKNAVPARGLSQVQPRATAQSPPGRAVHPPWSVRLKHLVTANGFLGQLQEDGCRKPSSLHGLLPCLQLCVLLLNPPIGNTHFSGHTGRFNFFCQTRLRMPPDAPGWWGIFTKNDNKTIKHM